jgi:hypothetical protein
MLPYAFDANDMKYFHPNGFVCPDDFSIYTIAAIDQLVRATERGRSSMLTIGMHLRIVADRRGSRPSKPFSSVWPRSASRSTSPRVNVSPDVLQQRSDEP